jgi:hypothetical protein
MSESTNAKFATTDPLFQKACELAGIPSTRRQASKFRRKTGRAWSRRNEAQRMLLEEGS